MVFLGVVLEVVLGRPLPPSGGDGYPLCLHFPNRGGTTNRVLIGVQEGGPQKHTQSVGGIGVEAPAGAKAICKILRVLPSTLKKNYKKQHSRIFSLEKQMIFPLQYEIRLFFSISPPEAHFRYTTTFSRVSTTSV